MRTQSSRLTVEVTDAEVDRFIEALQSPEVLNNLSGSKRREVQELCQCLRRARRNSTSGSIVIRVATFAYILRILSGCARWARLLVEHILNDSGN